MQPKKVVEIREVAVHARNVLGISGASFSPLRLLDELSVNFAVEYEIVEDDDFELWLGGVEASCNPATRTIYLTLDTYQKLGRGDPRAKFTVIHELGHLILGHNQMLHRERGAREAKRYEDSEWQADQFAAEFLMPLEIIKSNNINTVVGIQQVFGVSKPAAERRVKQLSAKDLI
ncbi:ImmA/IrrE family metallo-endopeptidase [Rhodoferax mekongensis]|uniref:ImmA/IrrE family metallo-endopeptidase n=1 Tax=Rhodoferax mekongensis TaxID=3068341 RepID=UPI0028BD74DF|nr:ImmA/IrrE family metallo-endopeptidase [Rhodoferax sp. TBRC 17199]MDT7514693.1 ImmA/IrrE family metallo-endopeptidase [Rhodoferax sp. TBRC 17199]